MQFHYGHHECYLWQHSHHSGGAMGLIIIRAVVGEGMNWTLQGTSLDLFWESEAIDPL